MCARRWGNILFYSFADNFTGSKDTDIIFLCQYITDSLVKYFTGQSVFGYEDPVSQNHSGQRKLNPGPTIPVCF